MISAVTMIAKTVSFSFGYHHLFSAFSADLVKGEIWTIKGPNGSGKTTLLKLFSGIIRPVSGSIALNINDQQISREKWYRYLSMATPYTDVIETFTPLELINFYSKFKPEHPEQPYSMLLESAGLEPFRHQMIRQFSSGMIQRMRLILALGADTPILLLDEPASNLDEKGKAWLYSNLKVQQYRKLCIIATNDPDDLSQGTQSINILDFK